MCMEWYNNTYEYRMIDYVYFVNGCMDGYRFCGMHCRYGQSWVVCHRVIVG